DEWEELSVEASRDGKSWDLAHVASAVAPRPAGALGKRQAEAYDGGYRASPWGSPTDLSDGKASWKVSVEMWPDFGFRAKNGSEKVQLAVGTGVLMWGARAGTVLPGDVVVFELEGQVVIVDLESRKAGVVAAGETPVVVLDGE